MFDRAGFEPFFRWGVNFGLSQKRMVTFGKTVGRDTVHTAAQIRRVQTLRGDEVFGAPRFSPLPHLTSHQSLLDVPGGLRATGSAYLRAAGEC